MAYENALPNAAGNTFIGIMKNKKKKCPNKTKTGSYADGCPVISQEKTGLRGFGDPVESHYSTALLYLYTAPFNMAQAEQTP